MVLLLLPLPLPRPPRLSLLLPFFLGTFGGRQDARTALQERQNEALLFAYLADVLKSAGTLNDIIVKSAAAADSSGGSSGGAGGSLKDDRYGQFAHHGVTANRKMAKSADRSSASAGGKRASD